MKKEKSLLSFILNDKISTMMNIKHIGHSSFLIELNNCYLLFDYYIGEIPPLDNNKKIFVFSSHHHGDHFNMGIFNLLKDYSNVKYVFSRDIKRKYGKQITEDVTYVTTGTETGLDDIKIETLRSTDEGVAFVLTVEDKSIYHAGDLNLWVWSSESEEYNSFMTLRFNKEMEKIKGRHFDVAFLVLDSRQGDDCYKGFDYFMKNTDTDLVYPMHYWDDSSVIDKLKSMPISKDYRLKIKSPTIQ